MTRLTIDPKTSLLKKSLLMASLLAAVSLSACERPEDSRAASLSHSEKQQKAKLDLPITINQDSVTMAADYILTVKPSRYQPSLGLQGLLEPMKQTTIRSDQAVMVQQVLVTKGQWVEKDTPMLVVQRQDSTESGLKDENSDDINSSGTNSNSNINSIDNNPALASSKTNSSKKDSLSQEPAEQSQSDTLTAKDGSDNAKSPLEPSVATEAIVVKASYSGRIGEVFVRDNQSVSAKSTLLQMGDDTDLRFIATLPIEAKPQLSVGQSVSFTADHLTDTFSGQVSKLEDGQKPSELKIMVHVIRNETNRAKLRQGMMAAGRVDYGQIEVGTIVPFEGIHDVDLTPLQKPPYKPLSPLPANVWIIKQDQRLTRQPVEVIEFDPSTKQYLVAGISNDSLICLAKLPIESAGKKVVVSPKFVKP